MTKKETFKFVVQIIASIASAILTGSNLLHGRIIREEGFPIVGSLSLI